MRPGYLSILVAFLMLSIMVIGTLPTLAQNTPPTVTGPSEREVDVNLNINLVEGISISDPDNDPLTIQWDYNHLKDSSGDGNFTNDNEYKGMAPKTNVTTSYNTAGNFTVTLTVSDGTDTTVKTFLVRVEELIGEKATEYTMVRTSFGKQQTVAKNSYISWKVYLQEGDLLTTKVTVQEGSGMAVLWVNEKNYPFMKSDTPGIQWYDQKRSKPVQDKVSYTKAAPSNGNYYIVFYNRPIEGDIGGHITNDYVRYDMSLKKAEPEASFGTDPMLILAVVGVIFVVIIIVVVLMVSKKKKFEPLIGKKEEEKDELAHIPPEMRPKYQEWLHYEKTYGHKHPEAPYSLVQKESEKKEMHKFENYTCPDCDKTLSFDNFSKKFYCYTCKKDVPQNLARPPQPKVAAPPPAAPPPAVHPPPHAPPPQQPPPPAAHPPPHAPPPQPATPPPAAAPAAPPPQQPPPPAAHPPPHAPPPQQPPPPAAPPQKPLPPPGGPPPQQAPPQKPLPPPPPGGAPPPPPQQPKKPLPPPPPQ